MPDGSIPAGWWGWGGLGVAVIWGAGNLGGAGSQGLGVCSRGLGEGMWGEGAGGLHRGLGEGTWGERAGGLHRGPGDRWLMEATVSGVEGLKGAELRLCGPCDGLSRVPPVLCARTSPPPG